MLYSEKALPSYELCHPEPTPAHGELAHSVPRDLLAGFSGTSRQEKNNKEKGVGNTTVSYELTINYRHHHRVLRQSQTQQNTVMHIPIHAHTHTYIYGYTVRRRKI